MQIGRKDISWNYAATFLRIASSALILPFILRMMSSEMVGIWIIFMTINTITTLLDFGFNSSFTRNVTYVFSGVRTLKVNGVESVSLENQPIDYGLLKGIITVMRWLYFRMAIFLFILLSTFGTYYIYSLLHNYKGDHQEVYIAWALLCVITTYNLFTMYYDSLLQGKGLVKRSKQIFIIGESVYLVIVSILIIKGYGLVAIISAQASSVIIVRWLSYHSFFTSELINLLQTAIPRPQKEILKSIYPNAFKIGLTSLGGITVQRSSILIGSLYLTFDEIASYGITIQLISAVLCLAGIYTATFQPKIAQLRVENNKLAIKDLYLKGQFILVLTTICGGTSLLLFGDWGLNFIGSQTKFMPTIIVLMALIISFLEKHHAIAGGILLTNNEVPFFKASLMAGATTILLLIIMFSFTGMRLWAMVLAPGIAHLYNNWKWPYEVFVQLEISIKDVENIVFSMGKISKYDN